MAANFGCIRNAAGYNNWHQSMIIHVGVHGAWEMPALLTTDVQVRPDKLEVVAFFCYLGDMPSAGGGCKIMVTTCVKTAWKKFRELLPVITSRNLSYKTRGHV